MKQGIWSALLVTAVIIALAVGFFGGRVWQGGAGDKAEIERLSGELDDLRERVDELEGALSSAQAGSFKVAYVDMFRVLQDVQEIELVSQALEQYREEQQKIAEQQEEWRKKFEQGEITKKELEEKLLELDLKLQELNLKLSAPIQKEMLQIIREIGQEKGYSLIIDNPASQLNAIVLYSQAGEADDITSLVTERLKAQWAQDEGEDGE